ncbi:MAG: radical SAM protein [Thermoplasmata archaeon]|nr:radical SAM protein [Thermoplasmata archaeon]
MNNIAFGPVPSRRLGRSLGVNNIPPKTCSYSCVYCQLGKTTNLSIERKRFYDPASIVKEVRNRVDIIRKKDEKIDYITFVPDGEPTLDINLREEVKELKGMGIKLAILTNSSLIWKEDVREDLKMFDLVSLKIDAVDFDAWKRINRPHPELKLSEIMEGIMDFSDDYRGELLTETMLIAGYNDQKKHIEKLADFIGRLHPSKSYISIPTRPPAEKGIEGTTEEILNFAYQIFSEKGIDVELLTGFEGEDFSVFGDLEKEILSIASVHPLREDILKELLDKTNKSWDIVEKLVADGKLKVVRYRGKNFYIRKFVR